MIKCITTEDLEEALNSIEDLYARQLAVRAFAEVLVQDVYIYTEDDGTVSVEV